MSRLATQSITLIEIDVPRCGLVFGQSPCTATGEPCYNTLATCKDLENYDEVTETLAYAEKDGVAPGPSSLQSVEHQPARIRLGEDLGERAGIRAKLVDHRHSDLDLDPYVEQRDYDPLTQGTYWGRFRARFPFLAGVPVRWIQDGVTRHYILEQIDGPDYSGQVEIVAKDPLKRLDGDRVLIPQLSEGELDADLAEGAVGSFTARPAGIGGQYDAAGKVAIGDEIIEYTRTGDAFTIVERASSGTEAEDHDEGDRVQQVAIFEPGSAPDHIYRMMVDFAGITPSLIDQSAWQEEDPGVAFEAEIAEPTPARQLIGELMEQAGLSIWYDEAAPEIRLRFLRNLTLPDATVSDDVIKAGSLATRELRDKRVSAVWVYYRISSPLARLDEKQSFRVSTIQVAEGAGNYGEFRIREVFCRWIRTSAAATQLADLIAERFARVPRSYEFGLMPGQIGQARMGGTVGMRSRVIQLPDGAPEVVPVSVISASIEWANRSIAGEELRLTPLDPDAPQVVEIEENGQETINLFELFDSATTAPITGDTVATFRLRSGVIRGAPGSNAPAITTGEWPSGATLTLEIGAGAFISGLGGQGGNPFGGPGFPGVNGGPGFPGGPALEALHQIEITGSGTIQGGAGGGGAGGGAIMSVDGDGVPSSIIVGGGGGGGAGDPAGDGGSSSTAPGQPGALTAGGQGGQVDQTAPARGGSGGDGGDPGQDGESGQGASGGNFGNGGGGPGGASGPAIIGAALVTVSGATAIIGDQI